MLDDRPRRNGPSPLVDGLRSTLCPEASTQGVIPEGGDAPNVVPQRAVVDYYIRYPDPISLEHINVMMDNAACAAEMGGPPSQR